MYIPSDQEIRELSLLHPEIHSALTLHYRGAITYQEALMIMVATLAHSKSAMKDAFRNHLERCTTPAVIRDR